MMPAAFCTVEDLEHFLQIDIPDTSVDASAERAIQEASAAIQNYCRQQIKRETDDEIVLDSLGHARIHLPELPVVEVLSVVEDGVPLVDEDDYLLGQHGILHRVRVASGHRVDQNWAKGIQNITIIYTHGHDPIPKDVAVVCTRAASRAYQAGLKASETEGVPGVTATSLGDYSVSYGAEGGGGTSGVLGASAAPLLLRSEKELLTRYRI